jgi:ATP-dependent helicase/nuclease subunit A
VATLLKQLLDQTHYRALLQATEGGLRAQRNIDKLLADAHTSGQVSVREFTEYVRTLRDVGARESEAPTEAGSAVQLMTVHKAKGLEFPVVVIADAAHAGHRDASQIRLDGETGVTVDVASRGEAGPRPAAHQLAALRGAERDAAEDRRLLYVAATRAQEKLLVSAHTKLLKGGGLSTAGWLELLGKVTGLDAVALPEPPAEMRTLALADDIGCRLYTQEGRAPTPDTQAVLRDEPPPLAAAASRGPASADSLDFSLVAPLVAPPPPDTDAKLHAREAQPPRRVWRVVPRTERSDAPAWVVGTLVHAALRHWYFADAGLEAFLRPFALEMGVVDEKQLHAAIVEARRMLRRFRAHALWAELDSARRWHEMAFSISEGERTEHGIIDLLYRTDDGWKIAEFKTDQVRSIADLSAHIQAQAYDRQMRRYVRAVRAQLGVEAQTLFVFLNVGNEVVAVGQLS